MVVIILRGIPGSGKSSVADFLVKMAKNQRVTVDTQSVICCADDYFTDKEGNYNYKQEEIGNAHAYCKRLFNDSIAKKVPYIIVSNTSTRASDVNYYRNIAVENRYMCFVMTVENWHNGIDVHNVPEEVKEKMREQLKNSMKL